MLFVFVFVLCFLEGATWRLFIYLFCLFLFLFIFLFFCSRLQLISSRISFFISSSNYWPRFQENERKKNLDQVLHETGTITSTGVVRCKFHSLITTLTRRLLSAIIRSRTLDSALNIKSLYLCIIFLYVLYLSIFMRLLISKPDCIFGLLVKY